MRRLLVVAILFSFGGVRASSQSPQTQPRLAQSDMTFLGSFAVDTSGEGDPMRDTTYGGYAMAVVGDTLYWGGHDWHDRLCRVRIPETLSGTAPLIGTCFELAGIRDLGGPGSVNPVGSIVYHDKLIVAAHVYYDGGNQAVRSHQRINLDGTGQLSGFQTVGSVGAGQIAGPMTHVPDEWRSLIGCDVIGGGGGYSIISRTSYGPSFYCFDPDRIGAGSVPSTRLAAYTQDHPLCGPKGCDGGTVPANPLFNWTTQYGGYAFPSGLRTILVVGNHGTGAQCYGTSPPCPDATGYADRSPHAPPYVRRVWAFDANDLLAVKNGTKAHWEPTPYAWWDLPEPTHNSLFAQRFGGTAYDPATRRLYISGTTNGSNSRPRVYVYQIASPDAPPPPPDEICGDGVDNDTDGEIDEGCPVDCVVASVASFVEVLSEWSPAACPAPPLTPEQTRTELWRRVILAPAAHGGSCPSELERSETRVETRACTPPVTSIEVTGTIAIDPVRLGPGAYLLVVITEHGGVAIQFPGLRIPGADRDLRAGDTVNFTVALTP